jgi:xylulokinase
MALLGVDVGTTHCKAALFTRAGKLVRLESRATPTSRGENGGATHDPDELWSTVCAVIRETVLDDPVEAVGVTSMAEAGLLLDAEGGEPRTPVLAWFDARATSQAEDLTRRAGAADLFRRSGLHSSFKFGLPKLLWLEEHRRGITDGACWLSVADYIAYRLTGARATDPTLAARTFAYAILDGRWDDAWIRDVGLDPALFPPVLPSGAPAGAVSERGGSESGLRRGIPVSVCGHDHICSMLAAGVVEPGTLLDSMGTAESLMAVADRPDLGDEAVASGLALVPHVLPHRFCWLGGLSASGGSVEWMRRMMQDPPRSYGEAQAEVDAAGADPTGILYYPYLLGSGAPRPDRQVRGAFTGLRAEHTRGHLLRAVLEGVAYEAQSVREAIERVTATPIRDVVAVGGGTRNSTWMQIRADVLGCMHTVPTVEEAAAFGAALLAGIGSGTLAGVDEVVEIARFHREVGTSVLPNGERHAIFHALYEHAYLPLQTPLRQQAAAMADLPVPAPAQLEGAAR